VRDLGLYLPHLHLLQPIRVGCLLQVLADRTNILAAAMRFTRGIKRKAAVSVEHPRTLT